MKDVLEVRWADGRDPVRVDVDGRDWLHWEQRTGQSSLELVRVAGFAQWYAAGWAAMHRQGMFDGTPEEFAEQAAYVLPTDAEPAGPTTPPEASGS